MRGFERGAVRVWPALLCLALAACAGSEEAVPEPPEQAGTGDLRKRLAALEVRDDPEGLRARADLCERLRTAGVPDAAELQIRAAEAQVGILSQPAPDALKREAAAKLARSLGERATEAAALPTEASGPIGPPLRKLTLLMGAAYFADYAVSDQRAEMFQKLAEALDKMADLKGLTPEARTYFQGEVRGLLLKSMAARRGEPPEATPEARKFCEMSFQTHLEEGIRDADFGTREKADRSKSVQVVQWYLRSLTHFAVARESRLQLSPSQANALGRQDIVVRSLCDLLCGP